MPFKKMADIDSGWKIDQKWNRKALKFNYTNEWKSSELFNLKQINENETTNI
jgi:hypothetical protein